MPIIEYRGPYFSPDMAGGPTDSGTERKILSNPLQAIDDALTKLQGIADSDNPLIFRKNLREYEARIRGQIGYEKNRITARGRLPIGRILEESFKEGGIFQIYFSGPVQTEEHREQMNKEVDLLLDTLGIDLTLKKIHSMGLFVPESTTSNETLPSRFIANLPSCPNIVGTSLRFKERLDPNTETSFLYMDVVLTQETIKAIILSLPLTSRLE